METVYLEGSEAIRPKQGFDAWDRAGNFAFRTTAIANVFRRRAGFFRVNATGRFYRVISAYKTIEVSAGAPHSAFASGLTANGSVSRK